MTNTIFNKNFYNEYKEIIEKNPLLKKDLECAHLLKVKVEGEGVYLGNIARTLLQELRAENKKALAEGKETIGFSVSKTANTEKNSRILIAYYSE